eukprot:13844691-Ditylum_brightwellii.AAC.1
MADVIESATRKMSGAAGPDGVNTTTIQDWLLRICLHKTDRTQQMPGSQTIGDWGNLVVISGEDAVPEDFDNLFKLPVAQRGIGVLSP